MSIYCQQDGIVDVSVMVHGAVGEILAPTIDRAFGALRTALYASSRNLPPTPSFRVLCSMGKNPRLGYAGSGNGGGTDVVFSWVLLPWWPWGFGAEGGDTGWFGDNNYTPVTITRAMVATMTHRFLSLGYVRYALPVLRLHWDRFTGVNRPQKNACWPGWCHLIDLPPRKNTPNFSQPENAEILLMTDLPRNRRKQINLVPVTKRRANDRSAGHKDSFNLFWRLESETRAHTEPMNLVIWNKKVTIQKQLCKVAVRATLQESNIV